MTPDQIIDAIIVTEGGYIDHPDDRGGATKWGITIDTLSTVRNITATKEDVRDLSKPEAHAIYLQQYVIEPGFIDLPRDLQPVMVDAGVLHGPARAIRMLQEATGETIDGILGPLSKTAARNADRPTLVNAVSVLRLKFVANLVSKKPEQAAFLRGWTNRLTEFIV